MSKNQPPFWAQKIFEWYCDPRLQDPILGDLDEQFEDDIVTHGATKARRRYVWNVIRFFRPGIIKSASGSQKLNYYGMFTNSLKTSYRVLVRNKLYTAINVLGFSLGMGIAIALYMIYQYENSFDSYHPDQAQLYQVMGYANTENGSHIPGGVVNTLKSEFPQIEEAVSVHRLDPQVIKVNGQNLTMKNAYFVDPAVFDLLAVEWLVGSPEVSLAAPNMVVLDASTATRLFPNQEAMGKVIHFDNQLTATVSGIIEDTPSNTEFPFKMIFSFDAHPWEWMQKRHKTDWGGGDSACKALVKVTEDADVAAIERRISEIGNTHDEFAYDRLGMVPITRVHLDPDNDPFNYYSPVWLTNWLLFIGVFLLTISCINFINLSTAHATSRMKGIVLRKILGSNKTGLLVQFMTETGLLVFLSLLLALGFAGYIIQYANNFFYTNISLDAFASVGFATFVLLLWVSVTIISGLYPSVIISRNQPISFFRDHEASKTSGLTLRQVLIAFQFAITTLMIVAILVGTLQMGYLYDKDLGFKHDNIIVTDIPEPRNDVKKDRLKSLLESSPAIEKVTLGLSAPAAARSTWWGDFTNPLFISELNTRILFIDPEYLSFYDIELITGRNFLSSDTGKSVGIVNESIVSAMGLKTPEEALGQAIAGWPGKFTIVGVVEDYHSESLKANIQPQVMIYNPDNFYKANIEVNPNQLAEALPLIEATWKATYPDYYFNFSYLNDQLQGQYESDNKFTNFLGLFAILSIVIGSLGLYGLIYFLCQQKAKEIGIRKVLGALERQIVGTLARAFVRPMLLSLFIAIPLSIYFTQLYLSNYVFQVEIQWFTYLMAAILAISVASIPVILQARVAARQNPVESLKDE